MSSLTHFGRKTEDLHKTEKSTSLMVKQSKSPFSTNGVNSRHNQSLFILVAHTACVMEANTFTYHADL